MRLGFARGAAALCLTAAVASAGILYAAQRSRAPLVIEVMTSQSETMAAAQTADIERARVLIYHTHTWEAYEMEDDAPYQPTEAWRTKDERYNMVRVGEVLADELEKLGFVVVHDKTAFEPPNLSQAYTRSLEMLGERLAAGETYDYVLDIHRDAYSGLWNGANCVERENGERLAYVMLLVGKGTGATGSGFDERPDWPQNLALAEQITQELSALVPGISREVKIKTGRFNQHVSTGALLIEVGNNKNTLSEALASCPVIAEAIARTHEARQSASP